MANVENPTAETTQFPSPAAQGLPASRATMFFIIVTVMLDFLAFGIIAPVLPNLIIRFEGGNIARASDITGYFGFAWNLMNFCFCRCLARGATGLGGGR